MNKKKETTTAKTVQRNKARPTDVHSQSYKNFDLNILNLAYFLGTTEQWYEKQVKLLGKRVSTAKKELPTIESRLDGLLDKKRLSKAEEKRFEELAERAYDLVDVEIFAPMEKEAFTQFPELIRVLALSQLVTIFEGYIFDVAHEIFVNRPETLRSSRELTADVVLNLNNKEEIIQHLADREIEDLQYKSITDVIKYFDKKFKITLGAERVPDGKVAEIVATRNIHVHNKGIVNQRYLQFAPSNEFRAGDYRHVNRKYLIASFSLLRRVAKYMDVKVQRKYFARNFQEP